MLRKILTALILIPLAVVIVAFAVANRKIVTVSFDPFSANDPAAAMTLPLFGLVILLLIVGVLVGGAAAWLGQGRWRRAARRLEREVGELQAKIIVLEGRTAEPTIIPAESPPPQRLKLRPPAGGAPV